MEFHISIWGGLELCLGDKPTKAPPWRRNCTNGNQKIITDWNICTKSTDCKG